MKLTEHSLERPLQSITDNMRAVRSLGLLGIETVDDFLKAPREQVLSLPGVDTKFCAAVVCTVRRAVASRPLDLGLVPRGFLDCDLRDLELEANDVDALRERGLQTVSDVLFAANLVSEIGVVFHAKLHGAFEALVEHGTAWTSGNPTLLSANELFARMTRGLSDDQRDLFYSRLGIATEPEPIHRLAQRRGVAAKQLEHELLRLPVRLMETAPRIMRLLRRQGRKELRSADGFVTTDRLAAGTLLHTTARDHDEQLPVRLLALCFPHSFHVFCGALTSTPLERLRRARPLLRALTRPVLLPMPVDELGRLLKQAGAPLDRGLLVHLLQRRADLRIYIDAQHGDAIDRHPDPMMNELRGLLDAAAHSVSLDKLVGLYRRQHGPTKPHRVLARLRNDSKCVEVAEGQWTLFSRCQEHLARVRAWAEDASARIRATGRCNVSDLVPARAKPDDPFLIAALLRRDPTLRDLGRGDFCPRDQELTPVVSSIERALRRAMGEVPLSRFLDNYSGSHKERVIKVLRQNRLFLFPSPDRVDLLTNYPFTPRRLYELMTIIDDALAERDGFAPLVDMVDTLRQSSLAAEFLTAFQLHDLLRRHGRYDLSLEGLIAAPGRGLPEWIRDQAVQALESAGYPRSVTELVHGEPSLAPFTDHLEDLLASDPRVEREGQRFSCAG